MSALFDFNAFLTVVLLTVCTCTYIKLKAPAVLAQRTGCAFPLSLHASQNMCITRWYVLPSAV